MILRGPRHNGRRTIAGALARALGRGLLDAGDAAALDDERRRALGPLATMLHAVPFVRVDLPPGETIELLALGACDAPLFVAAGRHGGVAGAAVEGAVTVNVDRPAAAERAKHWAGALANGQAVDLQTISERFRFTGGNIRRVARLTGARAASEGRATVEPRDVRDAARMLNREALETLATWLPPNVDWSHVAVPPHVRRDLDDLERRCRQRERLREVVGPALAPQLTCKTVAMLTGPSGVGKSICARALAASLHMDLYRLEVSAILDKYVGEAEKRLHRLFTRAEELDVVLLLDEGDGLMARRTAVGTATDRYANAETAFLLSAIESYDSILLITTNAADRIDSAFMRRMDVVIEFPVPDPAERFAIWRMHLPAGHRVDEGALADIASTCAISGGQIRNAVLHACSLALEAGGPPTLAHVCAGVEREYRKSGMSCPLARLAYAG